MIVQLVFEYLVNSLWQLPVLVLAAWLVVRIARPRLIAQHAMWLAVLALAVLLPLRGIGRNTGLAYSPNAVMADAAALPLDQPAARTPAPVSTDLQTFPSLRLRTIPLQPRAIDWLVAMYGLSIAFGLARLVHGWLATKRMVASAAEQPLTTLESTLLRACARQIHLAEDRVPAVRILSNGSLGPMVAGGRRPVLLLPGSLRHGSDAGFDDQALTAVLLHELAHVRRRDYLANLVARVVSLPIGYHPATRLLHHRIRQTREMICDAAAAGAFPSNSSYARSLLSLAEGIVSAPFHVEAVGLFDDTRNSLEERIMKLTESKMPASFPVRLTRIVAASVVLIAGAGAAAMLHFKAATPIVYAMQAVQNSPASGAVATPEPAPEPQVAAPSPAPLPKPTPGVKETSETSTDTVQMQVPTPQEQKEIDEQAAEVHKQMDTLNVQMKDLNIQLKDLKPIVIPKINLKILKSDEFRKQMEDLKVKVDTPEFRRQMDELNEKINSPEFRQQVEAAAKSAELGAVNSPEFKRQMEEMNRQMNSPAFQQQIELSKKLAKEAQADAGRRSAEARKALAQASASIAEAKKQVHDAAVEKQLDEAQRRIDDASKRY